MSLVPDDKIKSQISFNLAPMIDFLFLMLAIFATLAVTRATLFDTKLDLVKLNKEKNAHLVYPKEETHQINLSISKNGEYKWISERRDYPIKDLAMVQKELLHQYNSKILPKDKSKTQILLHIDKNASWESIANLMFTIRQTGFDSSAIYKPKKPIFAMSK